MFAFGLGVVGFDSAWLAVGESATPRVAVALGFSVKYVHSSMDNLELTQTSGDLDSCLY